MAFSNDDLSAVMEGAFDAVRRLRKLKGGEYAGDKDALANFRRNALACDCSMELVWRIYAGKHWDAITQYVADVQQGKVRQVAEPIAGRIEDLITYLCIFIGIIAEQQLGKREAYTPSYPAVPAGATIISEQQKRQALDRFNPTEKDLSRWKQIVTE